MCTIISHLFLVFKGKDAKIIYMRYSVCKSFSYTGIAKPYKQVTFKIKGNSTFLHSKVVENSVALL